MTVAELIAELSKHPSDAVVWVHESARSEEAYSPSEIVKVWTRSLDDCYYRGSQADGWEEPVLLIS